MDKFLTKKSIIPQDSSPTQEKRGDYNDHSRKILDAATD